MWCQLVDFFGLRHGQASIAIAHNLMIAASVGVVLACALWSGAPWLIQRACLSVQPFRKACAGTQHQHISTLVVHASDCVCVCFFPKSSVE